MTDTGNSSDIDESEALSDMAEMDPSNEEDVKEENLKEDISSQDDEQQQQLSNELNALQDEENNDDTSYCEDTPKPKFSVGEVVYARDRKWGGLLYKAIIRRLVYGPFVPIDNGMQFDEDYLNVSSECWHYYVHFFNWGNKWERYIAERDVFCNSTEMQEKAKKIQMESRKKGSKQSSKLSAEITQKQEEERRIEQQQQQKLQEESMKAQQSKAISRENKLKEQNLSLPRTTVKFADRLYIPPPLQRILVEEWDLITANKQNDEVERVLPNLPAEVTVKDALDMYLKSKSDVSSTKEEENNNNLINEEWVEMTDGIALLFDQLLPHAILYEQEIPQYKVIENDDTLGLKRNCEIYGSSYLLRLVTKLPSMIENLPKHELCITSKIGDLIHFLHVNNKVLFKQSLYHKPLSCEMTSEERDAKKICK